VHNTYPGKCYRCGKLVNAYEGHFELIPTRKRLLYKTKWRMQYAECAIKYRGTKQEV
jgi:hypothetical protein